MVYQVPLEKFSDFPDILDRHTTFSCSYCNKKNYRSGIKRKGEFIYKVCQDCFSNYANNDKKGEHITWPLFFLLKIIKLLPMSLSWKVSHQNADLHNLFVYSYSSDYKNVINIERSEFNLKHTMYVARKTSLFRKKWVDIEIYYENKALKFLQNRDNNALKVMQDR